MTSERRAPFTGPSRIPIAVRGSPTEAEAARGIQATGSISGSCRSSTLLRQLRAGGKAQLPSEGPGQAVARGGRAQRRPPRTPPSSQFGEMLHRASGLTLTIGRRQAFVDRVGRQAPALATRPGRHPAAVAGGPAGHGRRGAAGRAVVAAAAAHLSATTR